MADKSMPPVSEDTGAPSSAPDRALMPQDGAAQQPQDGGSVMITIPKNAFDSIHQIIVQLASGIDELAKGVNQQASQATPAPAGQPAPEAPAAGGGSPADEEFLNQMAEEGSARSR
jgi:hypothetical protein